MRIFLPLTAEDRSVLSAAGTRIEIAAGRPAWAVTAPARADRPGEDEEDLEYDALQDAVHVALCEAGPTSRGLVLALDVPDRALGLAEETGGAYGAVLLETVKSSLAAVHVTELTAQAAAEDDTDPALLWFDPSEGREAIAYLDGNG